MPPSPSPPDTAPTLLSPRASALELVGFIAFVYALREFGHWLHAPMAIRALALPLTEVVIVWALLRVRGLRLAAVGLRWTIRWQDLVVSVAAVAAVFAVYLYGRPLVANLVGQDLDLSAFDRIRGNTSLLVVGLVQAVVIAGFREELLYRGFLMTRVAGVFQRLPSRWLLAVLAQTVIFGLAHAYQGPTGVIVSGIAGLIFGMVVLLSGKRLLPAMVAHAVVDSLAVVAIFLGVPVL